MKKRGKGRKIEWEIRRLVLLRDILRKNQAIIRKSSGDKHQIFCFSVMSTSFMLLSTTRSIFPKFLRFSDFWPIVFWHINRKIAFWDQFYFMFGWLISFFFSFSKNMSNRDVKNIYLKFQRLKGLLLSPAEIVFFSAILDLQ